MHHLNKIRLNAGLTIKPELEVTVKESAVEPIIERDDIDVGFPITKGGKHRFILVQGAGPDSTMEDIISEVDTLALVDIARGAGAKGPGQEGWELFPVNKKAEALALAERRLAKVQAAANAEEVTEAKKADKDYDKDGKVETSEKEHKGAVDKAIKKKEEKVTEAKKADKDYDKDGEVESSEEEHKGVVDKKIKAKKGEEDCCEKCNCDPCECDKKKSVTEAKDTPQPIVNDGKPNLWNGFKDKDENPKPNKDKQSIEKGEQKVPCPANLLKQLKTEIGEAGKEAEYYKDRDQKTSDWYGTLATAMTNLHDCLSKGTVEHMQKAQIEFSSWMSIMQHKVPSEVTDFIMKGGQSRGLKDFYKEVKVKSAAGVDPTKGSYLS